MDELVVKISLATLAYFVILAVRVIPDFNGPYYKLVPVVSFKVANGFLSLLLLALLAIPMPTLAYISFAKRLKALSDEVLDFESYFFFIMMLIPTVCAWLIDAFQDWAELFVVEALGPKTEDRSLKYLVHALLGPVFFLDSVYTLAVDRRKQARVGVNRIITVIEHVFLGAYLGYAGGMCAFALFQPGVHVKLQVKPWIVYFIAQLFFIIMPALITANIFQIITQRKREQYKKFG